MISDIPNVTIKITLDKEVHKQLRAAAAKNKETISKLLENMAIEWIRASRSYTHTNTYTQDKTKYTSLP